MAISAADLTFTRNDGSTIPNGSLHALFPAKRVGSATDYAAVVITNNHPTLTLTGVKVWLSSSGGAPVAIGYANAPIAKTDDFNDVTWTAPTYSSPTTKASGLVIADVGPGQKFRIYVRRTLSSATPKSPQTARLYIGGTSPL